MSATTTSSSRPLVFITGATAGFGAATAELFARKAYPLFLTGRRTDRLKSIVEKCQQWTSVQWAHLDVRDADATTELTRKHSELLKTLGIVINNAGLALGTEKVQEGRIADWDTMIDTNVKGLLYITRSLLPFLIANKRGHIVNLGSVAGRWVYPGGAVYCASKFAVRALSEGLRMDLLGSGIRVSNLEPGMAETEFSLVRLGTPEKARAVYQGMQPLEPQDIAETILWMVERPAHVNIQELVIYPTDQAHVGMVNRS